METPLPLKIFLHDLNFDNGRECKYKDVLSCLGELKY